jgi:pimeloyl-ACP methyl ester carboxylesterase
MYSSTSSCCDFYPSIVRRRSAPYFLLLLMYLVSTVSLSTTASRIRSFTYKGLKLTYEYRPSTATLAAKQQPPLFLIHPIGVGLASWYWNKFMEYTDRECYAINLIGCGIQYGSDEWRPNETQLDVPEAWIDSCQLLLNTVVFKSNNSPLLRNKQCDVVVQGGLAPVGVVLAANNPKTVRTLILTSPPIYNDMITTVPLDEILRNYKFLRSPLFGKLAFDSLESKWAIEFFSNLFLFAHPCDDEWLQCTLHEAGPKARAPIQAFNAGMERKSSYQMQLECMIQQPTLVLQGDKDVRNLKRSDYASKLINCQIQTLSGAKALLPWELPQATSKAIETFLLTQQ